MIDTMVNRLLASSSSSSEQDEDLQPEDRPPDAGQQAQRGQANGRRLGGPDLFFCWSSAGGHIDDSIQAGLRV